MFKLCCLITILCNFHYYRICPAEKLSLPDGSVQLVTACNACHYCDLEEFYKVLEQAAAVKNINIVSRMTRIKVKQIFHILGAF